MAHSSDLTGLLRDVQEIMERQIGPTWMAELNRRWEQRIVKQVVDEVAKVSHITLAVDPKVYDLLSRIAAALEDQAKLTGKTKPDEAIGG